MNLSLVSWKKNRTHPSTKGEVIMIICQVDGVFPAMSRKDVEQELKLLDDVLNAIDGELIGAEVNMPNRRILAYVRSESEAVVMKIFEASYFSACRIACLGMGWQNGEQEGTERCGRPENHETWIYPLVA